MVSYTENGVKSSFQVILNTQGVIIKEKGFFSSSFKEKYSNTYSKIGSIKLTNKLLVFTLSFGFDNIVTFDNEENASKIKALCELGAKNPIALRSLIGDDNETISLDSISLDETEELADKNKFGAVVNSLSQKASKEIDNDYQDEDNGLQYTYDGITMRFKDGERHVDEDQKDSFPEDVQRIVFPASWKSLYESDFPNDMTNLNTLDFSKANQLTSISDDCFHDCPNLRVVVLPRYIKDTTRFSDCDNLVEIHIPKSVTALYAITGDEDNRITAYISNPELSFDEEFCNDCKIVYVPKCLVKQWREEAKEEDVDVEIYPLPAGYVYPDKALSEPWHYEEPKEDKVVSAAPIVQKPSACPPPVPEFSYHAVIEGQQRGPYNREQFKRLVDAGMITAKTLVWCNGMSGWLKAGEVEDLEVFFPQQTPPPLPNAGGCPPPPPCC